MSLEPTVHKGAADVETCVHFELSNTNLEPAKSQGYVRDVDTNERLTKSPIERRLLWKLDLTILPLASLLFLVAYMVREMLHGNATNISLLTRNL